MRPQVEVLEDETDLAAQAVDLAVVGGDQVAVLGGLELEGFTGNQDFALVRVFEQVDAAQQGGLAGAGRPRMEITSPSRAVSEMPLRISCSP